MSNTFLKEYQVVGRKRATDAEANPKIYRMRIFAPNDVVARSRFWYFCKLHVAHLKRANGEILNCSEISEKHPETVKNFGVWLRYNSRSGTHNMYKEYRDTKRTGAISQMYNEMAGRHRARWSSIQIIRVDEISSADLKRSQTKQFRGESLKFPLPHRVVRPAREFRKKFSAVRPSTHYS